MKPLVPRTVLLENVRYQVNRLYSSGIGAQYACTFRPDAASNAEKTLLLTEEFVEKNPQYIGLMQACAKRFDDSTTFAKYLGSSSFGQSQLPPDGIGKSEKE